MFGAFEVKCEPTDDGRVKWWIEQEATGNVICSGEADTVEEANAVAQEFIDQVMGMLENGLKEEFFEG